MHKKTNLLTTAYFLLLLLIILHTPIGSQFNLQIVKPVKASPATIQEEINAASPGDTVRIASGTYHEHVIVNKSVKLVGEKPSDTIIDGDGTGTVVRVTSPNVSIINFTIRNGGEPNDFGVWVLGVANTTIRNNIIRSNPSGGIQLRQSTNTKITDNKIVKNYEGVGIFYNSDNTSIVGNLIANNTLGTRIDNSSFNTFYLNNFISNTKNQPGTDTGNKFDNGAVGNYWSDYTGGDLNGDGIGDTPYPDQYSRWDDYPLMEPWSLIRVFPVFQKGAYHNVTTYCNSVVASFAFSQQQKQISFNVTGLSGTLGFCNVTIPRTLLNATLGDWTVLFDGTNITDAVDIIENATHTFFNFNYTHSTHRVRINGTWAIPNEPPIANFTYWPPKPTILDFINFTDTSLDPENSIVERLWDFGDGNVTIATTQFITHIYTAGETYNVTLTVKDDEDATDTVWKTITVRKLGTNLTIDAPLTATSGRSVTITADLEDEYGAPIWNATIEFYLFENGIWKIIGSSLTDSDGVAEFEYTLHDAGTFYIRAEFPGTQVYGKTTSDETELDVARALFDYTPYILVAVAAIAAIAIIAFAIWRKRGKPSKI